MEVGKILTRSDVGKFWISKILMEYCDNIPNIPGQEMLPHST